jgi:hypothetical protein
MPRGVVAAARTALVFVGSPLTISAAKPSANGSRAGNHRAIQTEFIRGCARLNKYADDSRRKGIVPQPATKFFYEFEYELCLVIIQNALETVRAQGRATLKMMAGCVVSGT